MALLISIAGLAAVAGPSGAATTRMEAELLSPRSCWALVAKPALSGGKGRSCRVANAPLKWTFRVSSGEQGTVGLHGSRDLTSRGFRVRIDGKAWTTGVLRGEAAPSALFHTSPSLPAGWHVVELEWMASSGALILDFIQLTTAAIPSSTTAVPAPSTTTVPPSTTTTTTVAPTTTTTAPPPSTPGVCNIAPADGQVAIAAAIQACPDGSTVMFPAGRTYHQTSEILVKGRSNLVIDGNGSTFVSSAPNDPSLPYYQTNPNWTLLEDTGVTLRNMTIRGNLPAGPRGILPGNQYNAGIIVYGGNGVFITDVSVYSVFGEFVMANPSGYYYGGGPTDGQVPTNVRITRLRGEHAGRQCVAASAAQGFWLEDSTLSDCYQNGVDIEPDAAGATVRDVHILRNTISSYYFTAVTVPTAYRTGDVDGVEIRGNVTLTPSDTCYPAVLAGGVQPNTNLLFNITVTDNRLKTLHEGVRMVYVGSGSVTGNDITITVSPGYCAPPTAVPVRLDGSPSVTVGSNPATGY